MKNSLVIAIDGPSGSGKTTVSRRLAEELGFRYVDTGAMYRAVALSVYEAGVDIESDAALDAFCSEATVEYVVETGAISVNGKDYTDKIRSLEAGRAASVVSSKSPVRRLLVDYQRGLAKGGSLVMEGRDIGTVVLPGADLKIFLTAEHGVRAGRRHGELGPGVTAAHVSVEIDARDRRDTERADSPLKKADNAVSIDTGSLDVEGVVGHILDCIEERFSHEDIHS